MCHLSRCHSRTSTLSGEGKKTRVDGRERRRKQTEGGKSDNISNSTKSALKTPSPFVAITLCLHIQTHGETLRSLTDHRHHQRHPSMSHDRANNTKQKKSIMKTTTSVTSPLLPSPGRPTDRLLLLLFLHLSNWFRQRQQQLLPLLPKLLLSSATVYDGVNG